MVESNAGTVETINPTLGSTVSDRSVQDMPLNGRNALDLVALQPGALPADNPGNLQGNLGTTLAFSVGGGRSDSFPGSPFLANFQFANDPRRIGMCAIVGARRSRDLSGSRDVPVQDSRTPRQ
jgi:hypothetical protein